MNIRYVDAHCHIQFEQYVKDGAELIARMREEGVAGIVVGVDYESSKRSVALAEAHEHLFASIGLHPNHATDEVFDAELFRTLAAHPKVVAIGECGLDYFRDQSRRTEQAGLLQKHIELAKELDKPLIIHARPSSAPATAGKPSYDAYWDLIDRLKQAKEQYPNLRGDVHFFVGGVKEAEALIALDFTVSFTAVITFTHDYDTVIEALPLASVLSETDAPYVAPASRRGERNDPLAAIEVVNAIARIRGEDPETVRNALVANARRLFILKR